MKKSIFIIATVLVLTGCGPSQFSVKQLDTRFSKDKSPVYVAENNRISSKSIAGGFHIDNQGVYINPFVVKDSSSGKITLLGFNIINKTSFDSATGGVNMLGIIREVVFELPSGEIIPLRVTSQKNRSSDIIYFNKVSRTAGYDKLETGTATISKEDFSKIASANSLSAKISGTRQSMIYEQGDIAPEFIVNLKQFYQTYANQSAR